MPTIKQFFIGGTIAIALIVTLIVTGINDNGYRLVRQKPSGSTDVIFDAGLYGTYFGSVWRYTDLLTFDYDPSKGTESGSISSNGVSVRYQDGGTGSVYGIVRFELPVDDLNMLKLHKAYRSKQGIASKLLRPVVESAHTMASGLMTSEESYAEKRGIYMNMIEDQLRNGLYVTRLDKRVVKDVNGKNIKKNVPVIVFDKDGITPKYRHNDLSDYGIKLSFTKVTEWTYEQKTLNQISDKREANMAIITSKANAERAKQDTITIEEQGKANVKKAKYEREEQAVKEVVDAERAKKVAEIKAKQLVEVARQAKLEAEQKKLAAYEEKKRLIALGQGESERKRLVFKADGALKQKLDAWVAVNKGYAQEFGKQKWVAEINMGGNDSKVAGSAASDMIDLLTVKTAKDLGLSMNMKAGK